MPRIPNAGRRGKSIAQKIAEGRFAQHPKREKPIPLEGLGDPVPPIDLADDEREAFENAVESMPPGTFTGADIAMLAKFATGVAIMRRARNALAMEGLTVESREGRATINPHVGIWMRASTATQQAAETLGLTPSARGRLDGRKRPPPEDDIPDDIFGTDAPLWGPPEEPGGSRARRGRGN